MCARRLGVLWRRSVELLGSSIEGVGAQLVLGMDDGCDLGKAGGRRGYNGSGDVNAHDGVALQESRGDVNAGAWKRSDVMASEESVSRSST